VYIIIIDIFRLIGRRSPSIEITVFLWPVPPPVCRNHWIDLSIKSTNRHTVSSRNDCISTETKTAKTLLKWYLRDVGWRDVKRNKECHYQQLQLHRPQIHDTGTRTYWHVFTSLGK